MAFGPYEIGQSLGKGGMAETFLAVRSGPEGFRQEVCLKLMLAHRRSEPDVVRGFVREAQLLATLRHPNIVQVLDFGEHGGLPFMALEWVDGIDLRELLRARRAMRRPLPEPMVRYLAIELASALHAAHTARTSEGSIGIFHRDLSPENVLLSRAGAVKLGDFGLAKTQGEQPYTADGVIKGKVPYMAPDYASSGEYDASCDHYSLSVVLFEALAGKLPFNGRTDLELMDQARQAPRPRVEDSCPNVTPSLAAFIARGLCATGADRYASPDEMLDAALSIERPARAMRELAELIDAIKPRMAPGLAPPETAKPGSELRESRSRKSSGSARRSLTFAALLMVLLLATGFFFFARSGVSKVARPLATPPTANASALPVKAAVPSSASIATSTQPALAALPVRGKPEPVARTRAGRRARSANVRAPCVSSQSRSAKYGSMGRCEARLHSSSKCRREVMSSR